MQQVGRPPEGGHGLEHDYNAIGLGISYRNKYDQKASGLDGGRGIVGSQMLSSQEAQLSLVPRYLQPHMERSPRTHRHPDSPAAISRDKGLGKVHA
jgi:hypothetical protein